jgi:hypothetical protein
MLLKIRKPTDKASVSSYIQNLPESKKYDVEIILKREKRSIPQNSLYWLWMACLSHETGGDKEQVHETLKDMFLPKTPVVGLFGEVFQKPVSTSKLDIAQFTEYLNQIQVFASSELGIVLPLPEDLSWAAFEETYKNRL